LLPLYADEIQAKALGMAVDAFEPDLVNGSPKRISTDEPGELVCTQPFPSQPVTFYGPGGEEKYFKSYFSVLPGMWVQGDLIRISTSTKGIQMLGRS
jgi:acetoacetyl-CoA synthetase